MAKNVYAVGVIFENSRGEILLLKRRGSSIEGGAWSLPGGKVDDDESPEDAAAREISEEIGFVVASSTLRKLRSYQWSRKDVELEFDVFKTTKTPEEITLTDDEHTAFMWVRPSDAYQRDNLVQGLYPILRDEYGLSVQTTGAS